MIHDGPKHEDIFPADKYLARSLIALGMEAIVSTNNTFNAQRYRDTGFHDYMVSYYGLPVRRIGSREQPKHGIENEGGIRHVTSVF